jgi:DMSO/TMAO reductase YedYZ molybdopterin-dependent catalytic subunit
MKHLANKRQFLRWSLASVGGLMVAGCDRIAQTSWFPKVLAAGESLNHGAQKILLSRKAMAEEFTEADLSPDFRSNGTDNPNSPTYQAMVKNSFADWSLVIDGLVEKPLKLSLAELHAMPSRTQITRHDCVEGWSAIGKWKGVPLQQILAMARPTPTAQFAVFHCADPMESDGSSLYYESIDLDDATHPQTILAYELNGAILPVANGAPLRLRVERQLGYKQAKYLMRIELVDSFAHIAGGKGGYWEDSNGYQWFAGI